MFRITTPLHASLAALLVTTLAAPALAGGREIPMFLAKSGEIKVNGVIKEWGQAFAPASHVLQGSSAGCSMSGALAYDEQYLYVALEVTDAKLVRTSAYGPNEDRAELAISFPDESGQYRTVYEVELYAGDPGKTPGQVKARGLGVVGAAQIVEAPTKGGYDLEVRLPWNLFPPAARARSGLRGALRYYNAGPGGISGVISTAEKGPAASLPALPIAPEQSLAAGLLKDRGIIAPPSHDVHADVSGDAMKERVLLYDRYLVVLGPHFRGGTEYQFNDLGVDPASGELPMFEVRDATGDGKADVIVRKRVGKGAWREILQVLAFDAAGNLSPVFEHETGISSSIGTIQNEVQLAAGARGVRIQISAGTASGYTAGNYREPTETARDPLLLPWGMVRSQTYEWDGKAFRKTAEQKKEPGPGAGSGAPSAPAGPPPPRPPTSEELLDQVFALYKTERKIAPNLTPRFDFVTNVAEDERPERIVSYDRDIVVFGKGFKQGRGYVYLTLSQFADARDIADMTARDLNGDGLADLVVRGVQRTKAPEDLGTGELEREVMFLYAVSPQGISRLFALENAIVLGTKRMQALVAFVAGSPGLEIEVRPGRAIGWTRASWPYKQDTEAVSGIEPLVLPWTAQPVRYRFADGKYAR